MFITSRESAMSPFALPASPCWRMRGILLGEHLRRDFYVANFYELRDPPWLSGGLGVPSIYQPGKTPAQRESPRFAGFFRVFLEGRGAGFEEEIYMLWSGCRGARLGVCGAKAAVGHRGTHN
jgi:hypothetical protein